MAKKIKVAKAAKDVRPRLKTSLYTSPSVTLHFGPTHQIYYLPEVLLQRLENIPSRDAWTREIYLVDVDASIGHVLIHFLHTGVYQTLNDGDVEGAEYAHKTLVRNEFQTAVLALEAAKKYSVPGLQELAQVELERQGGEMCLRDTVRAIREESIAGTSDENAWLRDFVSKKVRWTFEHDRPMLSTPELFENIESPTLMQLLAQVIIGLYSEEVDKLRKGKTATDKMSTPEKKEEDDLWGVFSFGGTAKNKKKNKGVLEEEPPPLEPEPELEPVVNEPSPAKEEDPWGGGWGKLEPEPEFVPESQLEPEPPKVEVDRYAELSKSQAKKLKAKLDKEAKLKEEEDAKRQKEEEEAAEIMQQEEKEAEQIRLEEEEAELKRMEEEEAAAAATAGAGVSSFDSAIETGAMSKDDHCELRSEHLSRDDGWQNCKPCELYMRKTALKLHLVGLPSVNELSTTNRLR